MLHYLALYPECITPSQIHHEGKSSSEETYVLSSTIQGILLGQALSHLQQTKLFHQPPCSSWVAGHHLPSPSFALTLTETLAKMQHRLFL